MKDTPLTIEKINDLKTLESIKNVWNSLLEDNDTKTIELTYEWQMSYWRQFDREAELFVLVVHEADSIIAISPLKIATRRILGAKVRSLEIIAARTSNYQDLVIGRNSESVLVCILDYLIKNQGSWDQVCFRHLPEVSKTARFFTEKLRGYPLRKLAETEKCTYLLLDQSWEAYRESLRKNRIRQMNKRMRRVERDLGKIQIRKSETGEQLVSDLQAFFALHKKRWNSTNTPSQFMDSRYCDFYSEAGSLLLPKGQMGLCALEAGSATLAQMIFFTFRRRVLLQLSNYDPEYSYYSPTAILMELFIDKTLASGIDEIDFGAYYPYKEAWANQFRNRLNLLLFRKGFLPLVIYETSKLYLAMRSRIRRHKRLLHIVKIILGSARVVRPTDL